MSVDPALLAASWPAARLGEMLQALARRTRVPLNGRDPGKVPAGLETIESVTAWMTAAAAYTGAELVVVPARYREFTSVLLSGHALVARLATNPVAHVAIIDSRRGRCRLLAPDHSIVSIDAEVLRAAVYDDLVAPAQAEAEALLRKMPVEVANPDAIRTSFLGNRLNAPLFKRVWSLRPGAAATLRQRVAQTRLPRQAATYVAMYVAWYGLFVASWWIIGRDVLSGPVDRGWLLAWLIVLLTAMFFRTIAAWLQGMIGTGIGTLIKERILANGLRLEIDDVRTEGPSRILARSLESHQIERALTAGSFLLVVGAIELLFAAVLIAGGGGYWLVGVLTVFTAAYVAAWHVLYRRRLEWTGERLAQTHDLVEKMVGFRTRVAQQPSAEWHQAEDDALAQYLATSKWMDRLAAVLTPAAWHGWLAVGLTTLVIVLLLEPFDMARVAVAIGGLILAAGALTKWGRAFEQGIDAVIAWKLFAPFLVVNRKEESFGLPQFALSGTPTEGPLLTLSEVTFSYPDRPEPVIHHAGLTIRNGDRLLLEGPSGGGKSTLAALLTSLRDPDSGLILCGGLDRHTLGRHEWRRRVVSSPQFHENYLFAETVAYNLLMGRSWPPMRADLAEAMAICNELGLGELLARMPGEMFQIVGESGWQLSHGERSRVFIARALLQNPSLLILDESFGALDPENLDRALSCVLARANAVAVIAHP